MALNGVRRLASDQSYRTRLQVARIIPFVLYTEFKQNIVHSIPQNCMKVWVILTFNAQEKQKSTKFSFALWICYRPALHVPFHTKRLPDKMIFMLWPANKATFFQV